MTNTNSSTDTHTSTHTDPSTDSLGAPSFPDPRPLFARAAATGQAVLRGIAAEQLHLPTPCRDFDVDQLSCHLLGVMNRIGVLGAGGEFASTPQSIDDIAPAERAHAYAALAAATDRAWSDDAMLATPIVCPWAVLPGAAVLMTYINEVSVHSWDLATATGQQPAWDDEVLGMAYTAMQIGLPAEGRSATGDGADGLAPFAAVVPVADDAPMIDRLVAWNGRQP